MKRACPACGATVLSPWRIAFIGRCPACRARVFAFGKKPWTVVVGAIALVTVLSFDVVPRPWRGAVLFGAMYVMLYTAAVYGDLAARPALPEWRARPLHDRIAHVVGIALLAAVVIGVLWLLWLLHGARL